MSTVHPKVAAATGGSVVGGAVVVIIVWVLSLYHIAVPDEVASALTIIVGALLALVAGYITPAPAPVPAPPAQKGP